MVAVGDEGLVAAELGGHGGLLRRVGHGPQAVVEAVLRGRGEQRGALHGPLDDPAGAVAVAHVREEQRLQVGGGGPHQGGAVLDDVRHDVLVGEDDALGGGGELQGADDAALEDAVAVLLVHVERGFGVRREDAVREPAVEGDGGLAVAGAGGDRLREDQPDDVVRIGGLQMEQSVRSYDDVVGRRRDGGEAADPFGDVTESAERCQVQSDCVVADIGGRVTRGVHLVIVCGRWDER